MIQTPVINDGVRRTQESGAIVILFASLMIAFFAFAALAIDLTYAASSIQQARNYGQLAALSALERYFFTTGSHDVKMAAALARANEVSQMNLVLAQGAQTARTLNSSVGPVLVPGQYFFAAPSDGSNPCVSGETVPCFVPYNGLSPVNSFRIFGAYYPDMVLRFASAAFGSTTAAVHVDAIAAVVPRHGCFVVDLSSSMMRETHALGTDEYGWYLSNDNPGGSGDFHDQSKWDDVVARGARPGSGPISKTVHYFDDYELMTLRSDADFVDGVDSEHHPTPTEEGGVYSMPYAKKMRVDLFRGGEYEGPEPLTTVFKGIERALTTLEERAVVGDMACIIFYDKTLNWARVFKLSDDLDYLKKFVSSIADDPMQGIELAIRHGLLPYAKSKTNLMNGISEAMRQLASTSGSGAPSSDFVVLIGDGQTNCVTCKYKNENFDTDSDGDIDYDDYYNYIDCYAPWVCNWGSWWPGWSHCPATPESCAYADADGDGTYEGDDDDDRLFQESLEASATCPAGPACSNSFKKYYYSMDEVKRYVSREVSNYRVPIHVMLVGKDSGPHTVDVEDPDNPGRCLSDAEKRSRRNEAGQSSNYPHVQGITDAWGNPPACDSFQYGGSIYQSCTPGDIEQQWNERSADQPFLQVNKDLYDIATMTGGLWAPIRAVPRDSNGNVNCTPQECDPSGQPRFADPQCRTEVEQVKDYMDEIMGQNPFTLVVPKKNYAP